MIAFRREQRRVLWMGRLFLLANLGFLGWVVYAILIDDRRDVFYALPSLVGIVSGLGRYLTYRVHSLPLPLANLRSPDAATRDRAWQVVSDNRAELLAVTTLSATIHEPPLMELDRAALTERVARAGDVDWRKILNIAFWVWLPIAVATFFLTLFYAYDPIPVRY